MKKILFVWLSVLCIALRVNAQIPYSDYHLVYFDDFNYDPATFQSDTTFLGGGIEPASGVAYGNWHIGDCHTYSLGAEIWDPGQITMPATGTIRLTANRIPRYLDAICGGGSPGNDSYYRSFKSGWLNTNQTFGPFGIMEVRMSIPSGHPWASFYMDNSNQSILPFEGIWSDGSWNAHIQGDNLNFSPNPLADGATTPSLTRDVFHIFSAVWTPNQVMFYLDDVMIATVVYEDVRTNFSTMPVKLDLATYPEAWAPTWTEDGIYVDIDYVKIYKLNCSPEINFSFPWACCLSKANVITSSSTTPVTSSFQSIAPSSGTVFEAEATTISSIFLADESVPLIETETITGFAFPHPAPYNGYFEIVPVSCESGSGDRTEKRTATNNDPERYNRPEGSLVSSYTLYAGSNAAGSDLTQSLTGHLNAASYNTGPGGQGANFANSNYYLRQNTGTTIAAVGTPQDVQINPNPTNGSITITYPCLSSGQLAIDIKDMDGRVRYATSVDANAGAAVQQTIDLSLYVPGIYFIELTLNGQYTVKKITKL